MIFNVCSLAEIEGALEKGYPAHACAALPELPTATAGAANIEQVFSWCCTVGKD